MGEVSADIRRQAEMGIVPPKLNFEPVREDAKKVITGAPFTDGPDSTLFADFKKKVSVLTAPPEVKERLNADASAALTGPFERGFDTMFAASDEIEPQAADHNGAWDLPRGAEDAAVQTTYSPPHRQNQTDGRGGGGS